MYDVVSDRRRVKLHNSLLNYGTPVQYSVFECLLDARQIDELTKEITRKMNKRLDTIRIYPICLECAKKVKVLNGKDVLVASERGIHISSPGGNEGGST